MNLYAPAFECVAFFIVSSSRIFIRGADKCDYRGSSGVGRDDTGDQVSWNQRMFTFESESLINLASSGRWTIDRAQGKRRHKPRKAERRLVRLLNGTNRRSMGIDPAVLPLPGIFRRDSPARSAIERSVSRRRVPRGRILVQPRFSRVPEA